MVKENFKDLRMKKLIKIGSQFSGVGAFEQSLQRLGIEYENIYAADIDKYARQTYLLNFEEPKYYIKDVYDTPMEEITEKHGSLDIAMFSPPCQSFSLAGKRKGEDSVNGVLFYNSHEFIQKNKPRYFIFENVKGLLSDDGGKTFQRWIDYLGGKSVNGNPVIFPHEESVPYHVYYQVLNAKHYGVPQNRERIFIIGIRDDEDNDFSFPKPFPLEKRLKDVLESEVDEKYFLSDKMIEGFVNKNERIGSNGEGFGFKPTNINEISSCITSRYYKQSASDVYINENETPKVICFGRSETEKQRRKDVFQKTGKDSGSFKDKQLIAKDQDYYDTLLASPNPQKEGLIMIPAPIVEFQLTGGKWDKTHEQSGRVYDKNGIAPTIHTMQGGGQEPKIFSDVKQINPSTESGGKQPFQHNRVYEGDIVGTLDTECGRPNYVVPGEKAMTKQQIEKFNDLEVDENIAGCITHAIGRMGSSDEYISSVKRNAIITQRIRRLTPKECMFLMNFNEDFIERTINSNKISDSQLYRQCGNSIVVGVLVELIKKLKL